MEERKTKIGWRAPANIALVKYWGKKANQAPENGSISITLDHASTTTYLTFSKKKKADGVIEMEYHFHGKHHQKFEQKVTLLLNKLAIEMNFLTDYQLIIESENNFPHSAGIASSASSMAALALCLTSMEELVTHTLLGKEGFYRRASHLARLGSGSASRSVYGGIVTWGEMALVDGSSNLFATPFCLQRDSRLNQIRDIILVVSSKEKTMSSSAGHERMVDHPYREGRKHQANNNLTKMIAAINEDDYRIIAEVAENEALSLHALLMTSASAGLLLQPNTLHIITEIKKQRESAGLDLFFTIDAGPNVHLIYYQDQREQVVRFVEDKLIQYCENGQWIDDKIGSGPKLLTPENNF